MPKLLGDRDIELLQEYTRAINELPYARGENKISLIVYLMDVKERIVQAGLEAMIK